ncbi:MAG: XRE family transcriptional regulator [Rhodospirillaceae bacterium]|nr:XRE family transcriptional regulator [Rhodospirillaceae bacterium]
MTHGTTNVYADLGLPDAEGQLLKAQLVSRLADVIAVLGISQTEAAVRIGLAQPDLSNILRGRFRGYSIERLMRCLVALGSEVDIVIRTQPGQEPETIHVHR